MMTVTVLNIAGDREWLRDVHGIEIPEGGVAIVDGNLDWPEMVTVFLADDYRSPRHIYIFDESGNARLAEEFD